MAAAYLIEKPGALDSRVNTPLAPLTKSYFQTHRPSTPLIRLPGGKAPLLGNVVLSARRLHGGQCEVVALDPLPSVSTHISGGLRLRFCFSSLADVCFNLIKRFTGLGGWMRASVGPSPGGRWGGWGRAPWAPSPGPPRPAHLGHETQ